MSTIKSNSNYAVSKYNGSTDMPFDSIFRQLPKIWAALLRVFSFIEYRFHKLTFGRFQQLPPSLARLMSTGALILICYFTIPWAYRTFLQSDSIYEDTSMLSFSLAPASPRTLKDEAVRKYVKTYAKIATQQMETYGIPASISIAQGIIESRCGESNLAQQNNNHFGIKCFKRNCKKNHCSNFTDDSHKDFFRKYNNPTESWKEHSLLLSSGRYRGLKELGNDYTRWAQGLQRYGYATHPQYAEMLIETIEKYGLDELDK